MEGEGGVDELVAEMREGFEGFFDVELEGCGGRWGFGEGGEGVPEEMVVVGLCGDVVEVGVGGAAGKGFVKVADWQGFVNCAEDVFVELVAEVSLVF